MTLRIIGTVCLVGLWLGNVLGYGRNSGSKSSGYVGLATVLAALVGWALWA